jgi:hypothetical protein
VTSRAARLFGSPVNLGRSLPGSDGNHRSPGRSCGLSRRNKFEVQYLVRVRMIDCGQSRVRCGGDDKDRIGSYTKLCDFTLLFMILQVELRLNKGSLVRPRLVDQVKARATIMTICEH